MSKYFNHCPMLSALAVAIGLAAGFGASGEAKPIDSTWGRTPVVELVPVNRSSPMRIIANLPAAQRVD